MGVRFMLKMENIESKKTMKPDSLPVERCNQTVLQNMTMVLASLMYIWPRRYITQLGTYAIVLMFEHYM